MDLPHGGFQGGRVLRGLFYLWLTSCVCLGIGDHRLDSCANSSTNFSMHVSYVGSLL